MSKAIFKAGKEARKASNRSWIPAESLSGSAGSDAKEKGESPVLQNKEDNNRNKEVKCKKMS